MKKFLFLIALFTLMGGANSVKAIVLGDEITSLGGITDGTKFIISDGTKAKYFYNSASAANEIKNANVGEVPADAYCYFTLEKYDGSEVSGDNIYWIKITDADGNVYPNGTNGGYYLNTIVNNGDVVISAQKAGWGGSTSALWKVTYDAEKGFSFQSVWKEANSGNSWLAIGNVFVGTQQYLKLYSKSTDALALQKAALESAINLGGKYSSFAKTTASWNALQTAISTGTTVLATSNDADELTAATTAINDAIAGLKLEPGYTNLTQDMFKQWNDNYYPTNASNTGCAYVLRESTGQPYGDASVPYLRFADVSDYSKLYVVGEGPGKPRIMMNRLEVGNGGGDANGGSYEEIIEAFDESKVEIDLTAYDYAHINAIKSKDANVTVSDMLLYRTINVGSTGYATFGSLYKNAKPNDVTAYAAKYEGGQVTLTPVTNVPAGKGVVIMGDAGSYAPTFDVAADDIDSDLKVSNGTVVGDGSTIYVLNKVADKVGFYLLKAGNTLEAGKAYLKIEDGVAKARAFIGISGMDVTGISTVKQAEGKKDDVIYNLNGQRVSNPRKGLFIKNGVKFLVD